MPSKPNTKEEAKPALVPKLRFPEFRGTEGWTEKPLKVAARINPANDGLPESFIYIDLESVDAGELKAKERISRIGAPSRAQRFVKHGDIIYQVVRPYQRNNLLCEFDDDEDYVASTGYAQLRATGSNRFLYQSIHTDFFVGRVIAKCTGSNYPAINSSDLAEILLPIPPSLLEQQKIAGCLSSVDELMAAQARKVATLKTHKKGLMQQLFPREGETQPRLRFPEFQNAGEWSSGILGALSLIVRGGSPRPIDGFLTTAENGLNWLKIGDVEKDSKYVTRTAEKVRPEALSKTRIVNPGDLILSNSMSFGRPYILQIKTCIHDGWIAVTEIAKLTDRDFLYYSISAPSSQSYFITNAAGSGVQNLNADIIKALPICYPSLPEQHRIATCLSRLDALITAEIQKLDALKVHKKGLMQRLFVSH